MSLDSTYYANFTEGEFAADEYFQQWVLLPNEQNCQFWDNYLLQYPAQQIAVNNAFKLVQHLIQTGFHIPFLSAAEKQEMKAAIFEHISDPPAHRLSKRFPDSNRKWWLLAASVFIMIFAFRFFYGSSYSKAGTPASVLESTGIRQIKKILLPDSSLVILNGNSTLRYNADFATASVREVVLKGNAYFQVKQTPSLTPFIVHADQLRIYVTGTEFNVNAHSKATDIVLTSGKINVTLEKDKRKTVYLEAGYTLNVDTLHNELITAKTNTELYTAAWKLGEWHFSETSLQTIARLINEYYGMEMIFTSPDQRHLQITAVVSVNDLSTLIRVIEKTLNISIQTQNQHLIIINPQSRQL